MAKQGIGGNWAKRSPEKSSEGIAGKDFPIHSVVPDSSFSCNDGHVIGRFYGDPEAQCQAFHICFNEDNFGIAKRSWLCPNETIFNQPKAICDWWYNFNCTLTKEFLDVEKELRERRHIIDNTKPLLDHKPDTIEVVTDPLPIYTNPDIVHSNCPERDHFYTHVMGYTSRNGDNVENVHSWEECGKGQKYMQRYCHDIVTNKQ